MQYTTDAISHNAMPLTSPFISSVTNEPELIPARIFNIFLVSFFEQTKFYTKLDKNLKFR